MAPSGLTPWEPCFTLWLHNVIELGRLSPCLPRGFNKPKSQMSLVAIIIVIQMVMAVLVFGPNLD